MGKTFFVAKIGASNIFVVSVHKVARHVIEHDNCGKTIILRMIVIVDFKRGCDFFNIHNYLLFGLRKLKSPIVVRKFETFDASATSFFSDYRFHVFVKRQLVNRGMVNLAPIFVKSLGVQNTFGRIVWRILDMTILLHHFQRKDDDLLIRDW